MKRVSLFENQFRFVGDALRDGRSGGPSAKRLAFLAVIGSGIVWLSIALVFYGMSSEWTTCFGLLLTAGTSGYIGGKAVESRKDALTAPAEGVVAPT